MLDQKESPAGGGAEQAGHDQDCDHLNSEIRPDKQALLDELARVREHLERRAAANEIISLWRDELRVRAQRMHLVAELVGVSAEEQDALHDEVQRYKRTCRALNWSPSGRRS
jgi:hypothetical protein